MKTKIVCGFALLALLAAGCAPASSATQVTTGNETGEAVLLFSIGMHIEPMGETAQGYRGGQANYEQGQFFEHHVENIRMIAQIVEAHGGRMTIQAQSPFTNVVIETGNPILAELAGRGHEMALHFHEDAHMGRNSTTRSVREWCEVMQEEIALVKEAAGLEESARIRYWSGGNLYVNIFEAAACAGLDVNSDWKNPKTQSTPLEFTGVNPWRPAGGTDGEALSEFTQHDPAGAVIFLPEGQYNRSDYAAMRRSETAGGDEAYFEYLKESLLASLEAAEAGKVNVFHFTIHPGEFRGNPSEPFAVIEKFLREVVDPLAASGQVQWATFTQMAEAYAAWEQANPGIDPR